MTKDVIYFLLIGLGVGALYGLLGAGIVIAHRGAGVINFAHGALAMYGVVQFTELRRSGTFVLPWIDVLPGDLNLPVHLQVTNGGPMALWPAVAGTFAIAVLLGLLVHLLVFRPLRKASPLGKVVASVGALVYLQGVALVHFGTDSRGLEPLLPDRPWTNFLGLGRAFPQRNLWAAVAAVLLAMGMWAFYRHVRFGIATKAAATNEKGAILLGYSPDLLAGSSWVLSSVVATAAGLIVGPIVGSVDPTRYTLFIVAALGAALIGGMQSVLLATLGGLALGMVETEVQFVSQKSWFPDWLQSGAKSAIPLLVVAVVLYVRGRSLPIRGVVEERRLPLSPQPVRVLVHAIVWPVVGLVTASILTGPWAFALTTSVIAAILMLSYVVLTGYLGQISFAQLALAGTAGFLMARLMSHGTAGSPTGPGFTMVLAVPVSVLVAVVVGVIVGLPALRIRGVQLAVVTIAAALFLEGLYFDNPSLTGVSLSDGVPVPPARFSGLDLGIRSGSGLSDSFAFSAFVIVVLTLAAVGVANIRRSSTGRRFLAVRANERAAAAAGIDVTRTKLLGFAISAGLAGLAGCMFAFQATTISKDNWVVFTGMALLAFAYMGGISSVNGAIVGGMLATSGLVATFFAFHFANFGAYFVILGGVGLVLTTILHPEGIAPYFQPVMRAFGNALVHWRLPEWRAAAARLLPVAAAGALAGWALWSRRPGYSDWMVVLGAALALVGRDVVLQIVRTRRPVPVEVSDVVESPPSPQADRVTAEATR